jgi:hypothetical protein
VFRGDSKGFRGLGQSTNTAANRARVLIWPPTVNASTVVLKVPKPLSTSTPKTSR